MIINDNTEGMDFIALVDNPAHMKGWESFNNEKPFEFKQFFNEEEHIVMGVAIATEVPIYRRDNEIGEHYVVFTKEDTATIWEKMMKSNFMHNVNEMHEEDKQIKDITLLHSFPIDSKKGILVPEIFKGQNLKDGSIIAMYKVNSPEAWAKVKSGQYRGFSIEGYFDKVELKIKKNTMKKESLLDKLKAVFTEVEQEELQKFGEATTVDGVQVFWEGDLAEGIELKIKGEDGVELLAPEGSHAIAGEEGKVTVVTVDGNGIIVSIEEQDVEEPMAEEEGDFDMDSIKKLVESLFNTQKEKHAKEIEELKAEFTAQNETMFNFIKENLDKEDKKKFTQAPSKSWKELTKTKNK